MKLFTDDTICGLLASSLETAKVAASGWHDVGQGSGSAEAQHISFLTIQNLAGSVVEDVQRIRRHSLVPANISVSGYICDVKTGQLVELPEATAAGALTA